MNAMTAAERSEPVRRREIPAPRRVDLNGVLGRVRQQLELTAGEPLRSSLIPGFAVTVGELIPALG